jgi:hypothetical protein
VSPSRYGDPEFVDDQPADPPVVPHDPRCRRGWLDRDGDRPVPCLTCKPHLAPGQRVHGLGQ